ncbi:unnamed protein product, partial [Protopolystoma xenopodis]
MLLLIVIMGRWLLPRDGISRDQLSQLLLINIGTAADILEIFEAFNEEEVRQNQLLRILILTLWQASLLQFCFNKTATRTPRRHRRSQASPPELAAALLTQTRSSLGQSPSSASVAATVSLDLSRSHSGVDFREAKKQVTIRPPSPRSQPRARDRRCCAGRCGSRVLSASSSSSSDLVRLEDGRPRHGARRESAR